MVGSYLHGPVLPVNPGFADALLALALGDRVPAGRLAPLDDRLEEGAFAAARGRKR